MLRQTNLNYAGTLVVVATLIFATPAQVRSQTETDDPNRQRAFLLFEQNKFSEAIPLLEKVVSAHSKDVVALERLGWSLFVLSASTKDRLQRKSMRERARELLERSTRLGGGSELSRAGLEALSGPDPAEVKFSAVPEADDAMREGEEAHARGDLDAALESYKRALKIDPKLYLAALLAGDMYFKKGYQASDVTKKKELMMVAGEWFSRAISIEENAETAYRYWGDALMNLGEREAAKLKFIDAIIAEPYQRRPYIGLTQWAKRFGVGLSHPEIAQPKPSITSSQSKDGGTTLSIDPKMLDPKTGPAFYWSFYDLHRSTYKSAGFQKDHPGEKEYRHSLKEEASALAMVARIASKDRASGKVTTFDASLENLIKLHQAGMIEPYVLFVRPDDGIAQDYPAYRKANRDKLRKYWTDFVVHDADSTH
jgi:tetratricopeptide (TPR) repeat protein